MQFGAGGKIHSFSQLPTVNINRSAFNLSHQYTSAFDAGYLVPVFCQIAYPGDTFIVNAKTFARLSTPIVPFMTNLWLRMEFFAVPWRILWTNSVKFFGEQANPGDSVSYTIPRVQSGVGGFTVGSLYDYLGIPTAGQIDAASQIYVNNLAGRAYNQIFNRWYRSEDLQNSLTVDLGDGPDTLANYNLKRRNKMHDYFTSCLPWPQKATAVSMPLGSSANVYGNTVTATSGRTAFQVWNATDGAVQYGNMAKTAGAVTAEFNNGWTGLGAGDQADIFALGTAAQYTALGSTYSPPYADLSTATAATINQWRLALGTQSLYEIDARYGTRYPEIIYGHFGVVSDDARMQYPEFLSGSKALINVNPVVQTSATGATGTPQANLAATALGSDQVGFSKSFTEHCIVLGIASVQADLLYQQGLDRMWTDQTKLDLYWPALANIGEQAVYTKEIYCTGVSANDNAVFGYQEKDGHLRYKPSLITGKMRSTASGTIDTWHLSQKFTAAPTLGDTFIAETPPISRVVAVTTEPQIFFDAYFDFKAIRPMPVYGIPGTLPRF